MRGLKKLRGLKGLMGLRGLRWLTGLMWVILMIWLEHLGNRLYGVMGLVIKHCQRHNGPEG